LLCYNIPIMFNIFKKQILDKVTGEKNKPQVFIFLGRSGCGKGTQADLLLTHLCKVGDKACKTLHIESGTLLREFAQGDNYTQKKIKDVLAGGILVPESMIVALWTDYIISNFTGTENMVFDGTPRKIREAQLLDDALHFYGIEKPNVVYVNVSRDWSEKRLLGRARKDDTPDAIERRLAWFESEVMKAIDFYRTSPYYNFIDVNGEQPIEDVQNEILAKLGLNK
jgi:adenylate kinase